MEERVRPKNQNYLDETVPQFNRTEFLEHFRVSREVANDISQRFANSEYYKEQSGPYGKLTSLQYTYIFLWYAGHQTASFRDVADRFNVTISVLHKIIKRMIYFLSNLSPEVIKWPNDVEKQEIEQYFRHKNTFPGIIGLIDGTHIKIDKPQDDPDSYINRKGFYSVQVQLVCDHNLRITDIFTGYPGSVHDARVFRTSPLSETLEEKCGEFHLLGDSAYPLLKNVLTPFPDRGLLNRQQINYNIQHSSNRVKIEHCNGVLKQKWRQLYHLKLRDIRLIVNFIRACCVLHNLGLQDGVALDLEENVEPVEPAPRLDPDNIEQGIQEDLNAVAKRNHIVNILGQ